MSTGRYKKADYFCFFVFIGVGQMDDELFYLIEAVLRTLLVAVLVYAAALLLLGGLTEEEILSMPKGAALARIFDKLHLLQAEKE